MGDVAGVHVRDGWGTWQVCTCVELLVVIYGMFWALVRGGVGAGRADSD